MAIRPDFRDLTPFVLGVTLGIAGSYLKDKFPSARYETNPDLPFHLKIADFILEHTAMRWLRIHSHHWHWRKISYSKPFDNHELFLEGAPEGNPTNNPFFGAIAHLGGRPFGHLIGPDQTAITQAQRQQGYFIGFSHYPGEEIFRANLKQYQPLMLLSGPDRGCYAYAMDADGTPIKLKNYSGLMHRNNLPPGFRVL